MTYHRSFQRLRRRPGRSFVRGALHATAYALVVAAAHLNPAV